ncbi:methyl-accepting chemotaxis protein [Pseudophaeobacter sp.]|uniref:methyl-accepting chemotaxis protein n=1 Tax=Pseudophaeobacter sp. TaxID=1971739 RepID=UPI0032989E2E
MKAIKTLKLAHKLPMLVIGTAVSLVLLMAMVSTSYFEASVEEETEVFLEAITGERSLALTRYLEGVDATIVTLAAMPSSASAIAQFEAAWHALPGVPGNNLRQAYIDDNPEPIGQKHRLSRAEGDTTYNSTHAEFHPGFVSVIENLGYYDAFLVDLQGNIIYTVFKEMDYGTNLLDGVYADSGLGAAFRAAMDDIPGQVYYSDLSPYAPSNDAPAGFAATPVADSNGDIVGILALQFPIDYISGIINNANSAYDSLNVYLVGADRKARTASRVGGKHKVLQQLPILPQIEAAFVDEGGLFLETQDAQGTEVVAVSASIKFGIFRWAVVAEIALEEIMAPAVKQRETMTIVGVSVAALFSIIGWLFAGSLTRPIDQICKRMESIAAGRYDIELEAVNRSDEIGKIARTLISMKGDLQHAREAEDTRAELQAEQQFVVKNLSRGLKDLADGNFTRPLKQPFPGEHEKLRSHFNQTLKTLRMTVLNVVDTAGSISGHGEAISRGSDDLSVRTSCQAATLEQTAAAMDELTSSVRSTAQTARGVEETMLEAKTEAEESGAVVLRAVDAMNGIEEASEKINQIISVIDDIAFQTNLLALNAGVEAARAGESGKGFAVVASEVRALAQRSSDAAMEIKTLIGDSGIQVSSGVTLVGQAGTALENIVKRFAQISLLVSNIAKSAGEQSTGLNEINTGMAQLDTVTQQNAAMVEESTAASRLLSSDAATLSELVAHFTTTKAKQVKESPQPIAKTG